MKKLGLIVLFVATVGMVAAASAQAEHREVVPNPLVLNFTGLPAFDPLGTECPAGLVVIRGSSPSGALAATARLCLLSETRIPPNRTSILSVASIQLAGFRGELRALVFIEEVFEAPIARRTITGFIYGGTGIFSDAFGSVSGLGTILVGMGPPQANLTLTFDFGSTGGETGDADDDGDDPDDDTLFLQESVFAH